MGATDLRQEALAFHGRAPLVSSKAKGDAQALCLHWDIGLVLQEHVSVALLTFALPALVLALVGFGWLVVA